MFSTIKGRVLHHKMALRARPSSTLRRKVLYVCKLQKVPFFAEFTPSLRAMSSGAVCKAPTGRSAAAAECPVTARRSGAHSPYRQQPPAALPAPENAGLGAGNDLHKSKKTVFCAKNNGRTRRISGKDDNFADVLVNIYIFSININ